MEVIKIRITPKRVIINAVSVSDMGRVWVLRKRDAKRLAEARMAFRQAKAIEKPIAATIASLSWRLNSLLKEEVDLNMKRKNKKVAGFYLNNLTKIQIPERATRT